MKIGLFAVNLQQFGAVSSIEVQPQREAGEPKNQPYPEEMTGFLVVGMTRLELATSRPPDVQHTAWGS